MALFKEIRQDDGVVTNYHRILYLKTTTNRQNSIVVASYVDAEARESKELTQPYIKAATYETAYDETMTISTAYDYLKTLPGFEGASDI